VANWLYTTARRIASNARLAAQRRAKREGRAAVPEAVAPVDQMSGRELLAALDEELDKLPPRYREPLVLCYLEGLSRDEAAARIGAPAATLKTQLERGRKKLGDALTKRGCGLGVGLLTLAVTSPAGASPPRLLEAVLATVSGSPPAAVAALARGVTVNMLVTRSIPAILAVAATALLGIGMAALKVPARQTTAKTRLARAVAEGKAKPQAANVKDTIACAGRVLGPDGRPVAGAKLYLTRSYTFAWQPVASAKVSPTGSYTLPWQPSTLLESATTGPDGRFRFTVPKEQVNGRYFVLAATAANHGPGWVKIPAGGKRDDLTIRLVKDDVAITGQIVDLEGKPIPGVIVRGLQINAALREDIGPWLEAVQGKEGLSKQLEQQYLTRFTIPLCEKVTTDATGRFRLTGIGRDRLVRVQIDGLTIVSQQIAMLTRPGKSMQVTEIERRPNGNPGTVTTYYGARFRHAAGPTKPLVGVIRDRDTKKPLAGVTIRCLKMANHPINFLDGQELVRTTTDAKGRYRLVGMPKGEGNRIMIKPPGDLPYLQARADVPDSPGLAAVTLDFELKRGVWIEGKITDKVTGKPLQAPVEYFALYINPNLRNYPGFEGAIDTSILAKPDGSYRIVGLPGPGLLAVRYMDHYLRASEREDEYRFEETSLTTAPTRLQHPLHYGAVVRIDPEKGADSLTRNVTLDPGWTFTGTVYGPDGKPLAGARSFGLEGPWWEREAMKKAEFTVRAFNPRRPREILFPHFEKGLVGVAQPPKEQGGSVTVRLEPGATLTGRLVDAAGKPRAGVGLQVSFRMKKGPGWTSYRPGGIETDEQGRFRLEALLPGHEFRLTDGLYRSPAELVLSQAPRSGQTKDLGDVQLKKPDE
jgi:protocatechuate 3,4-dioxygenase beta subunit